MSERSSISESLNWFGGFKSPALETEFLNYCIQQRSKLSFTIMALLLLADSMIESIASITLYPLSDDDTTETIYNLSTLAFAVVALILCLQLSFSFINFQNPLDYSYLQVAFIITINASFSMKLIKRIHLGPGYCISAQFNVTQMIYDNIPANLPSNLLDLIDTIIDGLDLPPSCPPANTLWTFVEIQTVLLMTICPQLLLLIIYEPRLYVVLGTHLFSSSIILYAINSLHFSTLSSAFILLSNAFALGEIHFQRTQSFLHQRKFRQLLEENERNADANHAMEMRSMIGNVAHDLKTPLTSFTNGLDCIREMVDTGNNKLLAKVRAGLPIDINIQKEIYTSIQACLMNMRNTNAFMVMTINRCIDYTKASKGMKLVPKYETVDLREALQFPIECMSNIQERIGIRLEAMSETICSHIITDKQWLQENLLCLLSNAVKYSTEGVVTINGTLTQVMIESEESKEESGHQTLSLVQNKVAPLRTATQNLQECLLFEIEDTGIGVSEEAMKNLFNPFKQAQRLAGGTGLGLYSLAKRMEALKGSYGVMKRRDGKQGSLFWFALPYRPDFATALEVMTANTTKEEIAINSTTEHLRKPSLTNSRKPSPMNSRKPSPLNSCKPSPLNFRKPSIVVNITPEEPASGLEILIVDDSPAILKMSSMMLKRQGHQIWTAENGEIALKRIEEKWRGSGKGFDLVLMDLQMPVMDGLEATRRLRAIEAEGREWMVCTRRKRRYGRTPANKDDRDLLGLDNQLIIGCSANSDYEISRDALSAGMNDFFGKPFSIDTFNKVIAKYL